MLSVRNMLEATARKTQHQSVQSNVELQGWPTDDTALLQTLMEGFMVKRNLVGVQDAQGLQLTMCTPSQPKLQNACIVSL